MKRTLVLLFYAFVFLPLLAQRLTIDKASFKHDVMNRDAQIDDNLPRDLNDKPCALLKVMVADKVTKCEGGNVGSIVDEGMVKRIYISPTAKYVTLYFQNHFPVKIVFSDYGSINLQSMETYEVALIDSTPGLQPHQAQGNFLLMTVNPVNASVIIDNVHEPLNGDGSLKKYLTNGQHRYIIDAGNAYSPVSGSIEMKGERISLPVTLQSLKASLTINASTFGCQIYINEDYKGTDSWNGELTPGTYLVEARKEGYRPASTTVTLGKQQTETVTLPALQQIFGSLMVDYEPVDADIYMDNRLLGKTPNVFSNIAVGKHSIKISKAGYADYAGSVTIQENQQASINGSLRRSNSASSSLSSVNNSSASGSVVPITVNGVTFNMIKVEGGTFTMGATIEMKEPWGNEKPKHSVSLSTYYIGETEVTQSLWKAVMGNNPSFFKGYNLPVEQVSWNDCQDFVRKLNNLTGKRFRLPTEAEWEFAARGGNKSRHTQYSGSSNIDEVAWYWQNSGDKYIEGDWNVKKILKNKCKTHPVKSKKANELGIYDMSGNVWEWCQDWYGKYSSNAQTNPTGPSSGTYRVCRGGGWNYGARCCRSANRGNDSPDSRSNNLGLRLVLSE
ncbi:hypothetical protein CIK99_11670 [Prevotella sp. P5-92]|uniref:SUMF1/EgtB/PvdO family nonheme iron enzyme n=1 Tax=Prevotella sp. P5-92 TaxID=2024222 RepID=UPI000B97B538|nr:SUMF1/EgtB/PvdO family nonheme iron enzyme [Prevotella sp. P5-92]OYP55116.1 hypothetical protein CIK99_11670 [Prevotella sp. P5-92]